MHIVVQFTGVLYMDLQSTTMRMNYDEQTTIGSHQIFSSKGSRNRMIFFSSLLPVHCAKKEKRQQFCMCLAASVRASDAIPPSSALFPPYGLISFFNSPARTCTVCYLVYSKWLKWNLLLQGGGRSRCSDVAGIQMWTPRFGSCRFGDLI